MQNYILIIDDDQELCTLLAECVKKENIFADVRYDGMTGIAAIKENSYQLIVLDVMLPGMDGFEVLKKIRAQSDVPILMLTAKDDNISKIKGLRQGADDYLTKPFYIEEFIARVYALIRRYTLLRSKDKLDKMEYKNLMIDVDNRAVYVSGRDIGLVGKEFDLLYYCAQNQGKILTKKQIYEYVWKEEYVFDDNNIMAVVSRIRKKMGDDSTNPIYLQTVKGIGYRFNKEV